MRRTTKQLVTLAMLIGLLGVLSVAGLTRNVSRPAPIPPTPDATLSHAQDESSPMVLETEPQPPTEQPRVSVTFNDDTRESYALLKEALPGDKPSRRPALDVWYGQYSTQDYRPLPASPLEKEPSRLNVKLSFAF